MNYIEARKYIDEAARFSMKLGLSRTEKILEILGNPHKELKCIHIAGTNGKGSTTAMITAVLKESGYKVGMYTSPYIEEFEERIQVNGLYIEKKELAEIITKVSKAVNKVLELGYDNPTQFEIITCAAFLYFYEQKVDFAVIEVGLGGRLDSTNVIHPILSVITSISYDHMNILGDTLSEIAGEKAGIIKEKVPVVLYPQGKEAEEVIEKVCGDKKAQIIKVKKDSVEFLECIKEEKRILQRIMVKGTYNSYNIDLALLGKHQLLNCATAIYTIEVLKNYGVAIEKDSIIKALSKVKWMGRFEIMNKEPWIIIDGAHNIDGMTKLKESLNAYVKYDNLILILGILADKQVHDMVKTITPIAKKVICVTPHNERAELADKLKLEVEKYNSDCEAVENYEEAYNKGLEYCRNNDLLLISGSLYMIGEMRKIATKNL
ncbi:folylpolyglutamate synthase/dihydrofolate synthase family protein [Clostridium sp. MB40-C1]|uniref:bifunctional folylpolyglutamate synthase/dihydrofolate synthase n=1 Tax=Clostridium sp. MB40-C1 TaxID=3070996 RepID=UPI0027E1BFF1|nr:folylpolyglutamate synthase/dihydrofolate synthase family protein [Clostridium sp. MB40-C1]WMJ81074.1 folylpolyglutamate synthase/dihydrofolate synthase family protein [Clostridium sp. MB40-C1]